MMWAYNLRYGRLATERDLEGQAPRYRVDVAGIGHGGDVATGVVILVVSVTSMHSRDMDANTLRLTPSLMRHAVMLNQEIFLTQSPLLLHRANGRCMDTQT